MRDHVVNMHLVPMAGVRIMYVAIGQGVAVLGAGLDRAGQAGVSASKLSFDALAYLRLQAALRRRSLRRSHVEGAGFLAGGCEPRSGSDPGQELRQVQVQMNAQMRLDEARDLGAKFGLRLLARRAGDEQGAGLLL